ncbi:MAG: bifunctional DNA primase/polymerase [Planctomycetaceae bacterium]
MTAMLEAALRYAELGYPVFPCIPTRKKPYMSGGFHNATTDEAQIETWWSERPYVNIGIPTEGLLVLDLEAESEWLNGDTERLLELAVAPMSISASGGRHYIFRQPEGKHWRSTVQRLAPKVDVRADGGLFIAPPSVLKDGKEYRWAEGMELDCPPESLPEPPDWLIEQLDALAEGHNSSPRVADGQTDANEIPDGQRNDTLANLAGTMRRVGMSQAEITAALLQVNADRCRPPLPEREVEHVATSVSRYAPDEVTVAVAENHFDQMMSGERAAEFEFQTVTSRELATNDYSLEYLIDGVLVRGQPMMIGGPKKSLKTNSSVDLALSLGNAGLFLGRFNVNAAVRVGVMSGESGAATIQETALRVSRTKDYRLEECDNVVWAFDVPQLNIPAHMAALRRFMVHNELEVIILDPTYMMMLGIGSDAGNLFVVGQFLKSITDLVRETGCTPILCHHLKKNVADPFEPAELDSIAWAGFAEFVRQWMLLNRRVKYDPDNGGHHEIWMSFGGSAGHSSLWGVDVDEGTPQDEGGRRWDVEILTASEAYAQRAEARQDIAEHRRRHQQDARHERQRESVLEALRAFPDGETPRVIRESAGVSGNVAMKHLATLVEEGLAEECTVKKHTREERAFRLCRDDGTGGTVPATPGSG